jgi:hypothetical protein
MSTAPHLWRLARFHGSHHQSNKAGLRRSGKVFGLDPAYGVRNCGYCP